MTAFRFDAEAALKRARETREHPNLPNLPNREGTDGAGFGGFGGFGTGCDLPHASAPDLRARLDTARARVARLVDADGIARSDAAITAVWDEAEALAAVREAEGTPHGKSLTSPRGNRRSGPSFRACQN